MEPADPDLLRAAVEIAREAGDATTAWFGDRALDVETKGDGTPVTAADRAAERLVRDRIGALFPDDTVIGEEEPTRSGSSGRTWLVDPIDGTKAFVHRVPLYSTLLAVSDEQGPAVGVIHLPALGETIWAGRGLGCFHNGRPASVSTRATLAGAYLMTSGIEHWPRGALDRVHTRGVTVRTWGDGYGYALVATGAVEAMFDPIVNDYDIAPMPVILNEAGGTFTDLTGIARYDGGSGLATNGVAHADWLGLLRSPA